MLKYFYMVCPSESDRPRSSLQIEIDLAIAAAKLNQQNQDTDEEITQAQFNAAVCNAKRIEKLTESGSFRILSVDSLDDPGEELISDFEDEMDALMYVCLQRQISIFKEHEGGWPEVRNLYQKCFLLSRGGRAREWRKIFGIEDQQELIAQDIEPGITLETLKKRLVQNYMPLTSEVMYLYTPEGNHIGKYPV